MIAGKSKGQTGKIEVVHTATGRVIVGGVNKTKRHIKPKSKTEKGSTIEKEAAIHASNVMLLDPKTNKPTRIGKKAVDGKNVRVAKKSSTELK